MPNDPGGVDLASRSWTEMDAALSGVSAVAVALLPVGSNELHCPHLALDTAVLISVEAAWRAARRLRDEGVPAFDLPALSYTVTEFSKDFPGAIGVSPATLHALLDDVCDAALSSGFAA